MAASMQTVAGLLQSTSDPRLHKEAEAHLKSEEKKPGFSLLLLNIIASEAATPASRLSGALYFKNFIRHNYIDEEGEYKLPPNEVITIKQELIGLMITAPPNIQAQLGEAVSIIADSDFYERWETLVDDLVSRLTPDNAKVNNGILEVAHSIFKRWRPAFRSDALFTEINHVLSKFGHPYAELLRSTDLQIEANKNNKDVLWQHFTTMNLLMKLFYDLSCQDLPPIFEENLEVITPLLHKYLTYSNPLLKTDEDSDSGVEEFVRAGICEILVLYVQKYEDAFGPLLQPFITSVWELLTTIGPQTKYDILVSKALHFLTAVANIKDHAQTFNNAEILGQIVEKVILPNVALRESDVELFEDEPIEYIRRDLEGSDADTRRRAATDFLRKLLDQFEGLVTEVVGRYISHYLTTFSQNPKDEWKSKDTAVYLFSSIAAKGAVTAREGVKTTNSLVDVVDFFGKNIAGDLIADPSSESSSEAIIKVDAIKYLYTFRSQLTKQQWLGAFPLLIKNLVSPNFVVHTYTAIALERVLSLTTDANEHVLDRSAIAPLAGGLMSHLFSLMLKNPAPEKVQENEFLMRCAMRVLIVIQDDVLPIADDVLNNLIQITGVICANPSNPTFYYYHFEALGALIRFCAPTRGVYLEEKLFHPFGYILRTDVQEFTPYIFQLFAALLEANPSENLTPLYVGLLEPTTFLDLYDIKGNVPALARLLTAMIPRARSHIIDGGHLDKILLVFQKLITGKRSSELYGFDVVESLLKNFPRSTIEPFFPTILRLILTRLENNPPETFKNRFVRFYHLICSKDGPHGMGTDWFINQIDSIQDSIYVPLYLKIVLPSSQSLGRSLDRKGAVIALTKTIADSQAFAVKYKKGWGFTCNALLKMLENPPNTTKTAEVITEADVDDLAFGVGFTLLHTCKKPAKDEWPEVGNDIKGWVGNLLKEADGRHGGKIAEYVNTRLTEEAKNVLLSYMR